MFRTIQAALIAVALTLVALVVPAGPAVAASCSTASTQALVGGHRVKIYCGVAGYFDGFGTTLTEANLEALRLYQLYLTYGERCSGSTVGSVVGGRSVSIYCPGRYTDSFGSNLTDAAVEARELVTMRLAGGPNCDGSSVATLVGGYRVTLFCAGRYVRGQGSTLTEAAQIARLTAALG
ncbi:hypothetical protein GCM10029963_34830 [Micromonospora andamanensis]|uniref:hypothetical protein n=1 Tax=Micromonospora andamanensis TaxID=1287068 RepID=UPI00195230E9|nr:hypothetical protein [Micromonospora andamanensis]GIJ41543.1 hypothetical protein Vwe01_48680 [Micromonospora andamanensis]